MNERDWAMDFAVKYGPIRFLWCMGLIRWYPAKYDRGEGSFTGWLQMRKYPLGIDNHYQSFLIPRVILCECGKTWKVGGMNL